MTYVVGAAIVWIILFAVLRWAMKHDAEDARPYAKPINPVHTTDDAGTKSVEHQQDQRAG
jgi:hypothetical protein